MRGEAKKSLSYTVTIALSALILFYLCGCSQNTSDTAAVKSVVRINDEFTSYPEVISRVLPDYDMEHADKYPFQHLRDGYVTEAFGAQAVSAQETGVAEYWYPQYLATMIIAVDRDWTDTKITGWSDLPGAGEAVGFSGVALFSYEAVLAAIAYGLDGEGYSLKSAANLLAELNAQGNLNQNSYDTPILICYDYNAAELIKRGRNLEIIVPAEGTLSYERGLLSTRKLEFNGDAEAALLSNGFRLLDGRCDAGLYPAPEAYISARGITDYPHFNTVSYDATRVMRRDVLHVREYSSADGREHQYWVLIYSALVAVWIISIINRAVQKSVRRAALYTGIILLGWITARMISYQLDNASFFNLTFWYSYYIFQLTLPVVILWLALVVDKPEEQSAIPIWMRAVHMINAILLLFVLTNNLHNLVFVPDMSDPKWGNTYTYTYGFMFYFVQAGCWIPMIAGVVMLLYKGRYGLRKRGVLFVAALLGLLAAYAVGYELRVPIAWESDYTMTVGVFILLLFETCIRSGIIPVNSKYAKLFAHSPLSMQITDNDGVAVLRSEYAATGDKAMYTGSITPQTPLQHDENSVLFSDKIAGGYVYWKEDVSKVVRLHKDIEESIKKLEAANAVLVKEEAIKRAVSEETSRTQLMKQLENEISSHIARLSVMMEKLGRAQDSSKAIARITLLLCYVKRRCNLFFRERETLLYHADELTLYMDELSEMAGYSGVRIIFTCELNESVPIRRATIFYDCFYNVLDWAALLTDPSILVHLGYESGSVVLRLLPSEDAHSFRLDETVHAAILSEGGSYNVKELDDAAAGISLSFPEGREYYG